MDIDRRAGASLRACRRPQRLAASQSELPEFFRRQPRITLMTIVTAEHRVAADRSQVGKVDFSVRQGLLRGLCGLLPPGRQVDDKVLMGQRDPHLFGGDGPEHGHHPAVHHATFSAAMVSASSWSMSVSCSSCRTLATRRSTVPRATSAALLSAPAMPTPRKCSRYALALSITAAER